MIRGTAEGVADGDTVFLQKIKIRRFKVFYREIKTAKVELKDSIGALVEL